MTSQELASLDDLFVAAAEANLPASVAREFSGWAVRLGGYGATSPRLARAVDVVINLYEESRPYEP